MRAPQLTESSGVVASRKFDRILWTHNDDGLPEIFAISRKGYLVRSFVLPGAENQDWEDIAIDPAGRLYLYENSSLHDPSHCGRLYILDEPNPFLSKRVDELRSISVCFPDKGHDTEAVFIWEDKAYLVTKPWDATNPMIFVLEDLENGGLARYQGDVPVEAMITGGDINSDGSRIVLLSYRALFVFEGQGEPSKLLQSRPLVCPLNAGQVEGVTWLADDIVLTNEQRQIFWVGEEDWKAGRAPFVKGPTAVIPYSDEPPLVTDSLEDWTAGTWLWTQTKEGRFQLARASWSHAGLHLGVRLPRGTRLGSLDETVSESLSSWFNAGRIYLLLNPVGDRPLVYGENDRCIVIGRSRDGRLVWQSRILGVATVMKEIEASPGWLSVEGLDDRIVMTLKESTPGFGRLESGREIGFNVIVTTQSQDLFSWAFLTQKFSFDTPSYWGLISLEP